MQRFEISINLEVRSKEQQSYGGLMPRLLRLRVSETGEISAEGFLEVCKILGMFHDLMETLKKEKAK